MKLSETNQRLTTNFVEHTDMKHFQITQQKSEA